MHGGHDVYGISPENVHRNVNTGEIEIFFSGGYLRMNPTEALELAKNLINAAWSADPSIQEAK